MTDYRTVTACRLCDSTELALVLDLGETPLANELDGTELFPLKVNRCGSCGHHQLSIAVSPERLWGPQYPYASGTSPVFRKHLEALADEVSRLPHQGEIRAVLEIASNDGTLCNLLVERGNDVVGVDPSGPEWCLGNLNLVRGSWPPPSGVRGAGIVAHFDVILALNVFAHVDDLHGFTATVKEALAPDGVFILEVGDFDEVVLRGNFDTIYHEHMSYHLAEPLRKFFARHGLSVWDHQGNESQGGSLRLYLKHSGDIVRPREPVDMKHDVRKLQGWIGSRAAALSQELNSRFQADQMVCIYGAPAKLTTLLYATGLQSMPFNCVGEDNPRKVGRTTPGNHIPIVSVEDMLSRRPDAILVAAWNFFDDIRDKLRRLGYAGDIINPIAGAGEVVNGS